MSGIDVVLIFEHKYEILATICSKYRYFKVKTEVIIIILKVVVEKQNCFNV